MSRVRLVWAWGPSTGPTARALLGGGIARRGGGGLASPERVPFVVVRGVWGQALPLPRLPALRAGCRGPLPTCCGRGCAGVGALHRPRGPRALWGAPQGASGFRRPLFPAARPLGGLPGPAGRVLWVRVLVCAVCVVPVQCVPWCWVLPVACPSGAPLSGALLPCCAPRVLAVPPSLRASLARVLATSRFLRGFVVLYSFLCPPLARPPPWHAHFPLPASLAPVLRPSSFSPVGSCETEGGSGRVGLLGN